jgi:hypothetical protein
MSAAVVLDSTPLGILCHPRNPPQVMACRQWVNDLLKAGRRVIEAVGSLCRIWISWAYAWNTSR